MENSKLFHHTNFIVNERNKINNYGSNNVIKPKLHLCSSFLGKVERSNLHDTNDYICFTIWIPVKGGTLISDFTQETTVIGMYTRVMYIPYNIIALLDELHDINF